MEEKITKIATGQFQREIIRKKPVFVKKAAAPRFADRELEIEGVCLKRNAILLSREEARRATVLGRFAEEKVSDAAGAIRALNDVHHTMGFENAEQEYPEKDILVDQDGAGQSFYRMQQYYHGIPVFGRSLILTADEEGNTTGLYGDYAPIGSEGEVKLTEEQARTIAARECGEAAESRGLQYYVKEDVSAALCWQMDTDQYQVFVRADNGEIVEKISIINDIDINTEQPALSMYGEYVSIPVHWEEGKGPYSLIDGKRGISIYDGCNEKGVEKLMQIQTWNSKTWAELTEKQAVSAFSNMITVHDYYKNVLGRNGADGKGLPVRVIINDYTYSSNAAFCGNQDGYTLIRVGSQNNYAKPLDVMGHEFTHAVNHATWNPISKGESGALNEAYADILGECIQDGILDLHREDCTYGANRNFENPGKFGDPAKYSDLKTEAKNGKAKDDYVHSNSGIMNHTAYLIQKKWPESNNGYELSALLYRSMKYMTSTATFYQAYQAVLAAAIDMGLGHKKIGAIVDAFRETECFSRHYMRQAEIVIAGYVHDRNGQGIPGVMVACVDLSNNNRRVISYDWTDSKGRYMLKVRASRAGYQIISSRRDHLVKTVSIPGPVSGETVANPPIVLSRNPDFRTNYFPIRGIVRHPDRDIPMGGVTVRVVEYSKYTSQIYSRKPLVELKTDQNGYFYTAALPAGTYHVLAYRSMGDESEGLSDSKTVGKNDNQPLEMKLKRQPRMFVTEVTVSAASKSFEARAGIGMDATLVDVDLNKDARGEFIYIGYSVGQGADPITDLLIFESDRKETWTTRKFTHNYKTATYERIDVDLNRGAGGKYLYLCFTRDKCYSPLTGVDAIANKKDPVREPYWSGVRKVTPADSTARNPYADANAGTGHTAIHVFQTRHENI